MKVTKGKVLVGSAIMVPLLLLGVCIIASRDDPPPDDGDLAVTRSKVADGENGFRFLEGLKEPEELLEEDEDGEEVTLDPGAPFGKSWNPQAAQRFLDENPELLERLEKILAATKFQVPRVESYASPMVYLKRLRDMAQALQYRAALRFGAGEEAGGFLDAVKLTRFGHLVQASEGNLIHCLIGIACESFGLQLLRSLVQRTKLPDNEVLRYLRDLDSARVQDAGLPYAYKTEHELLCDTIERMYTLWSERHVRLWRGIPFARGLAIKRNQTRRISAAYFRPLVSYRAPWKDPKQPLRPGGELPQVTFSWWPPTNLLGKMILDVLLPTERKALEQLGKVQAERSIPALFFAIRRFYRDQGQLPAGLDHLVPEYLDRVPVDPFDALPLKYSRDKKVVHTVGPNGSNADGSKEGLTWTIEL